ncbi:MAG: inosine-5-monophosphate dehydrogenase [Halobacteriales archaeon SW_8_66_22]|jgi:CBS domain-containing protein|nr:MAG: inosine-5-monophosphate dehydrogenase [Halobacteriales archaeon SW_8_66_22]
MKPDVTVREMMDREYVGVSESDDLLDCVELLLYEDADAAVVQRGSEHVGVVSQHDILELLVHGPSPSEAQAGDAMRETIPTIAPDASLASAADRMSTQSTGRLLVTDGEEPVGMLTERDLIATRRHELNTIETGASDAESVTVGLHDEDDIGEEMAGAGFDDQGICEVCGTLTHDLSSFNGQLLCADCREI